jgi:NADP-dependent 3-hydroxy acid dehydrogenase YdfG
VALDLAKAGASIHLIGRRLDKLQTTAYKTRSLGSQAICYSGDLATDAIELTQRLIRDFPHIDVTHTECCNVWRWAHRPSQRQFDRQYKTNVRAPYILTQALLPMLKARRGQVVFINSSSGIIAKPRSAQYDSTKHALAIADSLRGEVNAYGVRVLSGLSRTNRRRNARADSPHGGKPYRPELLLQPEDVASYLERIQAGING